MGIDEFLTCEVTLVPNDYVTLEGEDKEKFEMLLDVLEELEDVQNVYHNVKL
jgi:transcriptional/translational regulatory protein YebC/TACO1